MLQFTKGKCTWQARREPNAWFWLISTTIYPIFGKNSTVDFHLILPHLDKLSIGRGLGCQWYTCTTVRLYALIESINSVKNENATRFRVCPQSHSPFSPSLQTLLQTVQGPVVRRPISANPGLNFNPGLFFFSTKTFSRTIFSIFFRVVNRQIVDKKN